MAGDIEDEPGLERDVQFALRDAPLVRTRAQRDSRSSDWAKLVASRIIAHLKLANWIVRRGPPAPRHGGNLPQRPDDGS